MDGEFSIDRLFLRLVCADTNSKLQKFTNDHLFEILDFAGKSAGNMPKVMELLQHYNKMVKTNLEINFPVDKLIELFQGSSAVSANLSQIYLKMSKSRVPPVQQIPLLPIFLKSIDKKPNDLTFAYEIFALCFPALEELSKIERNQWELSEEDVKLSEVGERILARIFAAFLAFRANSLDEIAKNIESYQKNEDFSCAGLSPHEYFQISQKICPEKLELSKNKLALVKLLGLDIFSNSKNTFPLLILAAAANLNIVDEAAEHLIKKFEIEEMVDDLAVCQDLMGFYLGSAIAPGKNDKKSIIQPANFVQKQKILPFLTRSKTAPTVYMNNIKICIDGMENAQVPRLQTAAFQFFHSVIEKMPQTALKTLGATLFARLRKYCKTVIANSPALCLVYRCLGTLGKVKPELVFDDISIVNEMFDTIIETSADDVGYSVVDCLVAWLPGFCAAKTQDATNSALKTYISAHVTHENAKCRMVSLKYIEALIFSDEDLDLTWILLRACGDLREEMRAEAARLLEISLKTNKIPELSKIIAKFWGFLSDDVAKCAPNSNFSALIHQMCSRYIWAALETRICGKPAELRIVEGDEHWITVAPRIYRLILEENLELEIVENLVKMALFGCRESIDVHQYRIATCFLMALKNHPQKSGLDFTDQIQACSLKARDSTRFELSQAIAFLLSNLIPEGPEGLEKIQAELEAKNIPGLCWIASAYAVKGPDSGLKGLLLKYCREGYERPSSMLEAALGALGFLMVHAEAFPLPEAEEIAEKIAASRKDSLSQKSREAAARILGYSGAQAALFRVGEGPPQPELQLTVGEAMIDAMLGRYSVNRRNFYVKAEEEMGIEILVTDLAELEMLQSRCTLLLTEIIDEKLTSQNHHLRRAALVWLLVLTQRLSARGFTAFRDKTCLKMIQNAFADGLTENDEFTQDIASKGMGLVYSQADATLRKELVAELMETLAEGRKTARKIDGNTVLFEKGQLGKTPTGDNLTTYKELCTLASDLNQPDLVYKFMQLAKHNATWNAKKGAAFGFGAVLEQAKDELEPYFGSLVPKLFRYRYDPDIKVQQSMRSIWSVLTSNRRNVVDEFADEIAQELQPALINKEWRVRESACLAMSDLLRGHDTPKMHQKIGEYLESVLRVRDDIKESVRLAADKTAESIRRLIVRLASSTNIKKSDEFLSSILPYLVDQGIVNSTIKSNKIYCLALLLDLTKSAGKQLKPYLQHLIPILLDTISENESAVLNYVAVRADSAQLEALDDARANMARSSPMMTAINDLLPHVDARILAEMTPKIADQLRASVGVSTRSAAAQLITQLALRAPQLMMDSKPQCDKLFNSLIPGVRDRNPSIRKQFANSMSYLAKFVSQNLMQKLLKTVVSDLVTENEELKLSARHVLRNLSQNCSELLGSHATQIVPFVFLETCQEVKKGDEEGRLKREEWLELWAELVPSTSAAARLYKDEILKTGLEIVKENEVWRVRAQAARMIGATVEVLGGNVGGESVDQIIDSLLPTLSGRIWAGKEEILMAVAKTIEAGGAALKTSLSPEKIEQISAILKREAGKRNVDYSSIGLLALAKYCRVLEDLKTAEWLAEKVEENVQKVIGENRAGSDSDDETLTNLEKEIRISKIVTSNLVALGASLATFRNGRDACKTVEKLVKFMRMPAIAWKSKQNLFVELGKTVEIWDLKSQFDATQLVETIFEQADEMINQQKNTVAADALQIIIKMHEKREFLSVDWEMVEILMKNGKAGQITGLSNRLEHLQQQQKMEID